MVVRERCEKQLRQRLEKSEAKLAAATTEIGEMRKVCLDRFAVPLVCLRPKVLYVWNYHTFKYVRCRSAAILRSLRSKLDKRFCM